jgi:hypothetical protein
LARRIIQTVRRPLDLQDDRACLGPHLPDPGAGEASGERLDRLDRTEVREGAADGVAFGSGE